MKQLISLKNICRSYRNGDQELQVLKNINLEVNEGEFVAIMGPSGSVNPHEHHWDVGYTNKWRVLS